MSHFRRLASKGLAASALLVLSATTVALAMWRIGPADVPGRARTADLVVAGEMVDVERELVRFRGHLYAKRVGTIRVEKVLLRRHGADVPEYVRVVWGNHAWLIDTRVDVVNGRQGPGLWLARRLLPGGALLLFGPEDEFFVPEAEAGALLQKLAELQPLGMVITRRGESFSLRIRYLNFGDEPREATLWAFKDGKLLAPAPIELKIIGRQDAAKDGKWPVLARTGRLLPDQAETMVIEPHSYVERVIDVSNWISDELPGGPALIGFLEVSGKRDLIVRIEDPVEEWLRRTDHPVYGLGQFHVFDDWDDTVWWFPSASKLFWLMVILGPVAAALGLAARKHGARLPAAACAGTLLGLVWAWLLAAYAPDAVLSTILAGQGRVGAGYSGVVLLGLLLLAPPCVVGTGMAKWRWGGVRLKEGAGLLGVWLGLPLVVALVHLLVLGPSAIL